MQQIKADECGEPEPVLAVVMREQQADEDERASEPADDHVHFHMVLDFGLFMETGRSQPAENGPVDYRDDGIAGEWTSSGGATHKHIPAKA